MELNIEGCIRLAEEIGRRRGNSYREEYFKHVTDPERHPYEGLRYFARKLQKPPTCLDESDIRSLQMQVEKDEKVLAAKRDIINKYFSLSEDKMTPKEIAEKSKIGKEIIERWIKEYERKISTSPFYSSIRKGPIA
ncbi:hypothetical protein IKF67_01855 [Candidatus Saccharibacteria bacterium]|nr:hypothetical protein [Candidatus Saccharibacteria bacterium]